MELVYLVLWFALSIVVGRIALARGRNFLGWFALSLFILSPALALIILLCFPNLERQRIEQTRHEAMLAAIAAGKLRDAHALHGVTSC